jgi:chorismate synthase
MNSFGQIFRISIFGESHGEGPGVVIDGCPAGLPFSVEDCLPDLERRKGGIQKGTTPRKEDDIPIFKSGLFNGMTTGAPIAIFFENKNTRSADYAKQRAFPRPGHADFVAHKKYGGYEDYRGGGHFSARLTVGIVAVGVLAKRLLQTGLSQTLSKGEGLTTGITIQSYLTEVGGEPDVEKGLQRAIEAKDSVGGIAECRVTGLPVGLGEPFWDSIESVMSHAMFAIPAVKGVEFGAGFAAARMFGSQHNDAIEDMSGKTATNNAGGIVGGISNGNELVFRIAIKPTSSTPKEQLTLNWETGEKDIFSVKGRHDLCVALRATPIVEAMAAIVLADFMMLEQMIPRRLYPHFYHVTKKANWEKALQDGFYTAPSLESEGFIHNSKAGQVAGVLERYYKNETNLVKLTIDPSKLKSELKYELAPSVNEWFPHVFGPINIEAVVAMEEI